MNKDDFLKSINDLIKQNSLYHAMIISSDEQETLNFVAEEITRQIFCKNHSLQNDDCEKCKKIISKNTLNTFFVGDGVTRISKSVVKEIILKFSLTSLEENISKVYVIANGENLSDGAANSILKFLEEPPLNTYAIILTVDKNQILSTVKSRCKMFYVKNEIKKERNLELINLIIKKNKDNILEYLIDFKKREKNEIISILNDTLYESLERNIFFIQEFLITAINEIKAASYISLILENLFIKIYEAI